MILALVSLFAPFGNTRGLLANAYKIFYRGWSPSRPLFSNSSDSTSEYTLAMETFKNDHKLSYLKVEDPPDSAPGSPRPSTPLTPNEQAFVRAQSSGFWGAGWSWEISSCVLAIGALVGIIVVLYVFDGQSTPDWPYGITLNALISVLVTIMKAAMAFPITEALSQLKWSWFNEGNKLSDLALLDAASRGAFGAFIVLFRFIPRYAIHWGRA